MAPADASALAQIEDHGARLRELESNYADVASQLAANSVQLSSLTSTVENGMESLGQKMETFTSSTQVEIKRQGTIVDTLDKIEKDRVERHVRRRNALRTYIQPFMIAASGVMAKELGVLLWRHLHGA